MTLRSTRARTPLIWIRSLPIGIALRDTLIHPSGVHRTPSAVSIWNDAALAALRSPQPRLEVKALRAAAFTFALRSNTDSDGASCQGEAYFLLRLHVLGWGFPLSH
ncbi:hypothetical protein C8R45DRAFT_1106943 [Mycena sanguinolenta]|nr:hypothetical protein C8R45DRAFT_1106943 [Mycena sanguinolenta]